MQNIPEDYSENNDLAAKMPDKLRELQELFFVEATKYNVFPLDNYVNTAFPLTRRDPSHETTTKRNGVVIFFSSSTIRIRIRTWCS
jgi:hypothetical protein